MLLYNSEKNNNLLFDKIFRKKCFFKEDTNYTIITGYIGYSTPKELIGLGFKNIDVIIGMYGSNIKPEMHAILLKIQEENENIKFFYTDQKIHSKLYIWHVDEVVQEYAIGSANFSSSTALMENFYRETLDFFENQEDSLKILQYYENIKKFLIPIKEYNIKSCDKELCEMVIKKSYSLSLLSGKTVLLKPNILGSITKKGEVSVSSALNWGFSRGLPLLGDAYLAISSSFIKNNLNFIPPKIINSKNIPIEVLWDDNETMIMLMEGNQSVDGVLYPKQISSYKNKSLLGTYLRKRIGDKIGLNLNFTKEEVDVIKRSKNNVKNFNFNDSFSKKLKEKIITKDMLEKYGRTTIDIKKIKENTFYFDFSTKKNI